MSVRYFFIIFVMFFMAGCAKKDKKNVQKILSKSSNSLSSCAIQEMLALHSEIPDSPLGLYVDQVKIDTLNPQAFEIIYKSKKNISVIPENIEKSYISDMELLGWQLVGKCATSNIQLLFQRPGPSPFCSIVIEQNRTVVTILPK